jgi:hypothetical protein
MVFLDELEVCQQIITGLGKPAAVAVGTYVNPGSRCDYIHSSVFLDIVSQASDDRARPR